MSEDERKETVRQYITLMAIKGVLFGIGGVVLVKHVPSPIVHVLYGMLWGVFMYPYIDRMENYRQEIPQGRKRNGK